jgi:hypothetical protein
LLDQEEKDHPLPGHLELRQFAWGIIRGDLPHNPGISDDRCEQWRKRARRRIEVHGDWLNPEDEGEMLGNKVWFKKEDR